METAIDIVGETTAAVDVTDGFPTEERRMGFECSSGDWIERDYRGVAVADVLDTVALPEETTHLRVTAADGHVACPAIVDALEGLIVTAGEDVPRFVAPGVIGPRTIKRVRRIEAVALSGEEDPTEFETVPPDSQE
jgi:DMSO/TMAO reductase YedYZ molybdopterin-dependent catalytic subunit